ncbi:MAG: TlpA family protein disulfide reductase [Bryobacterales bacterium]|jgi:peroxiredoxin|nr:TlpA family protein disulfide reductase [Bryobacterales bacterium]
MWKACLLTIVSAALLCAAGELSGRRAPGFSLPDSSAQQYDPQDYRGKVLLVDFMQANCPHCATFSRILEQVKAKYGDRVAILSIVNPPSDQQSVAKYRADNKVTTPILFDCGQVAYSYLKPKSPQIAVPHVFLIDADGVIRNDFGFSPARKDIFEGKGIFAEIDKLLGPKK